MIKKTVILGLIVCSFLVTSTIPVVAIEGVIDDDIDDVLDYETFEETSEAPNIDIDKVTYERNGQTVTIKLSVNEQGEIENKGNIDIFRLFFDDLYAEELINQIAELDPDDPNYLEELEEYTEMFYSPFIGYLFILETKENFYNISYVNEEYIIKDSYSTGLMQGDVDVDVNELTISFDLLDSGDRLVNLSVLSMNMMNIETPLYEDDISMDIVDESSSSKSSSSSKTPGFEMIALLAALAIAFIILRRKKQ